MPALLIEIPDEALARIDKLLMKRRARSAYQLHKDHVAWRRSLPPNALVNLVVREIGQKEYARIAKLPDLKEASRQMNNAVCKANPLMVKPETGRPLSRRRLITQGILEWLEAAENEAKAKT
jgi:hypothetical protein